MHTKPRSAGVPTVCTHAKTLSAVSLSSELLPCSTRVCACTSPAFEVDAAAACCSTSPDVFQLSGILLPTPCPSAMAISSAPWRFFAGPWTTAWTSPATSPAGQCSSGAAWSRPLEESCRRRPRRLEQKRPNMERQTRRRSHRQISTHLLRCRWPPAPRLARQASRPTRPSPAMGRRIRVERPRRRPKDPRPRSGKARGSAPTRPGG